jgi:deoxyhypusine synthase
MLPRSIKMPVKVRLTGPTAKFVRENYHHYSAQTLKHATMAYKHLLDTHGKMFVSMAGAMSTGRLGISLAKMIRQGYVSGLSVTGANLEEDVFNLIAHNSYVQIPNYKDLGPTDDAALAEKKINRVTDTAIPATAMKEVEDIIIKDWKAAKERKFPHEFLTEILLAGKLTPYYQVDPAESWLLAAAEADIPIVTPGWEDSTLGNVFTAMVRDMEVEASIIKSGIEAMNYLADWYLETKEEKGFFQIGGGIAGDFAICVVPFLRQDCRMGDKVKHWAYFAQCTNAIVEEGGYSGAEPNEKITWDKIGRTTPSFVIKGDASINVPLIFNQLLGE